MRDFPAFDADLLQGMNPESLDLAGTATTNLASVAAIRSLRRLNLASTPVTDLSPLAGTALESLDIARTRVADLSPLRGLPLKRLVLAGTLVSDISPLAGMPLKELDIQDTLVSDLVALKGMPLVEVMLSRRRFDNFDTLRDLPGLRKVSDYTVGAWYEAAKTNTWPEPVPVSIESMRGGGRMEFRFVPDKADKPSENTRFHFLFDGDGRLARAYAVILPGSNILYDFGPTTMRIETNVLSCEAMVSVMRDKRTEYAYRFGGEVRPDGTITGWFKLRYEVEIQDPERGYFLIVHEPEGKMTGRVVRGAGAGHCGTAPPTVDWPGWRGPAGDGIAAGATNLMESLDDARLCWVSAEKIPESDSADGRQSIRQSRTGISGGYSGTVVYGGRVYLYYYQPSVGACDERLAAHHVLQNGWDRRKWYVEADDVVLCLDASTGATVWKRVFARQSGLIAFDKDTGVRRWHVAGACDMEVSPVVWRRDGREYVLVSSEDSVRCFDPATGKEEWSLSGVRCPTVPGVADGMLVANDLKQESLRCYPLPPSGAEPKWTLGREYALRTGAPVASGGLMWIRGDVGLGCADLVRGRIAGTNSNVRAMAGFVAVGDTVLVEGFIKLVPGVRGFALGTVSNGTPRVSGTWLVPHASGTTPAVADGRLFFRGPNGVYCYDLRKAE